MRERYKILIIFLLLVLWIIGAIAYFDLIKGEKENACKEIGFEKYTNYMGNYCEDKNGNLYTIKLENDGFLKYSAKEITIYDYSGKAKQ